MPEADLDAIVVGSGPNGLAAAIALAQAGRSVRVIEGEPTIGGGTRTEELTLPRHLHDVCSAVHPLLLGSPFLSTLPLAEHGLAVVHPEIPLAHPLDGGRAVALHRSIERTAAGLGRDGRAYERLLGPLVRDREALMDVLLGPPLRPPRRPLAAARFAALGIRSAAGLTRRFDDEEARALLAGNAAHSMRPLTAPGTGAFALLLVMLAHGVGWPVAVGGSRAIADAMASYLRWLGGEIQTGTTVTSFRELPPSRAVILDVTPRALLRIAGDRLTSRYRRALARFRYGPGIFKVDYALSAPVPWEATECHGAGTVHVGGTRRELAESEADVAAGRAPRRPYVLVAQQSLFDGARAPAGAHTLWAYCHVPNGSAADMTDAIDRQIERFAPGFRDVVTARHSMGPAQVEARNPNYVGGDINGGLADLRQLLARPALRPVPHATSDPRIFLCSSSTPPGGGVHGMCGWHAAQAALRGVLR
ncbi:MAG TPA: NAD(P)/FAD-dependent oxidoreductase [Gaiellales bacterium]|nr:NAD(P)/FAD-dependent oxidoreductase [Gaiellales bacterium]